MHRLTCRIEHDFVFLLLNFMKHHLQQNLFLFIYNNMIFKELSPNLGKSTHSISQHQSSRGPIERQQREVLWNVVEPGDPYDIRQSTINRIHNDSKKFMGENPEIVCLLQAAEIQRLNQFLSDYSHKYRDLQRRELDRHSYEIQIKQLHQELNSYAELNSQNFKMTEFIKKLTDENEYLKSRSGENDMKLRMNYDSALRQIQNLGNMNADIRRENQMLKFQLNSLGTRLRIVEETKNEQISHLRLQLSSSTYKVTNSGHQQGNLDQFSIRLRYESEITRQEHEIRRLSEQIQMKNLQIREMANKNSYLLKQCEELGRRLGDNTTDQSGSHAQQAKIALLSQQIQRLNMITQQVRRQLQEKNAKEVYWTQNYRYIQNQFNEINDAYRQLEQKYEMLKMQRERQRVHSGSTTERSEFQINRLTLEIKRLQEEKAVDMRNYNQVLRNLQQLQFHYNNARSLTAEKSQEHTRQLQQLNRNYQLKISQLESRTNMISQQLERVSYQSSSKINIEEYNKLKNYYNQLQQEFEAHKRVNNENTQKLVAHYEQQIIQVRKYYEERMHQLTHTNESALNNTNLMIVQFENRIQSITRESNRLNQIIQERTQENNGLRNTVYALQQKIYEQYQVEAQRRYQQYEVTIQELKYTIEQANMKNRENDGKLRMMNQLERQVERLRRENEKLRREIQNRARNQGNISKTAESYLGQLRGLGQDNQKLRRQLQNMVQLRNKVNQYENRMQVMSREIQNLNQTVRVRVQNHNRSQITIKNLQQDLQRINRNFNEKINSLTLQLQAEDSNHKSQFINLQNTISQLQRQNNQLISTQKQTTLQHNKSSTNLQQTRQKLINLEKNLQLKIQEHNKAENVVNNQKNVITRLQNTVQELQRSITEKYEVEYRRSVVGFEETERKLKREIEEWKKKSIDFENRMRAQQGEVQRLHFQINSIHTQKQSLLIEYRKLKQQQHTKNNTTQKQFQSIINEKNTLINRLNELENITLFNLNKKNQQLTLKLHEAELKVSNLSNQLQFTKHTLSLQNKNQLELGYQQRTKQLYADVELWQKRYKQLEVEMQHKYDQNMKQKSVVYEGQIGELRKQVQMLKNRNDELQRKNKNYEGDINRLTQNLRNRNMQSQKMLQTRIKQHQTMIIQRLQAQNSQKVVSYEQNIQNLTKQLQDRNRALQEYDRQLQSIKQTNSELTFNYNQLQKHDQTRKSQISNYERRITEIEKQLLQITANRQELQSQLFILRSTDNIPDEPRDRDSEYAEYRLTAEKRYLEYQHKLRYTQQENNQLSQEIANKNEELTRMSSQMWNMKNEFEQMRNRMAEFQRRNVVIDGEDKNNQAEIIAYEKQISELNNRLNEEDKQFGLERMKTNNKIRIMQEEIQRLNEVINSLNERNEPEPQNDEIKRLQEALTKNLNKISVLQQEIQRLKQVIVQHEQYGSRLKLQNQHLLMEFQSYKRIQSNQTNQNSNAELFTQLQRIQGLLRHKSLQYQQLSSKYKQLLAIQEEYIQISESYQSSKKHIVHYEQSIKKLYAEFDRLQKVITELKEERQQFFNKNQRLRVEVEKMKGENKSQGVELQELRLNLSDQLSLEKRVKEYMSLMVVLFAEIETLRRQLIQKQKESRELKGVNIVTEGISSRVSERVK